MHRLRRMCQVPWVESKTVGWTKDAAWFAVSWCAYQGLWSRCGRPSLVLQERGNLSCQNQRRESSCTDYSCWGLQKEGILRVARIRLLHTTTGLLQCLSSVYQRSSLELHSRDYHTPSWAALPACKCSRGQNRRVWFLYRSQEVSFQASGLCVRYAA